VYHKATFTCCYIMQPQGSNCCVIIDPVTDYDAASGECPIFACSRGECVHAWSVLHALRVVSDV